MTASLGLRWAVGVGLRGQKARQVAPGITGGLDLFAADREQLALNLAAAEALVEEAAGIVAQYPDDRRAAAMVDQPLEQRQQQAAADTLILPVRRDIKGEDFASKFRLAAAP